MANQYTAPLFVDNTHAQCSKCKEIKEHKEFHNAEPHIHRYKLAYYCKDCACKNSRKNHNLRIINNDLEYKNQKRNNYIKNKFGLTLNEYIEKLKAQEYKCAICGMELPTSGTLTHLDHCHTTGKIRAFLCTNCNRGLGHFKENVSNLEKAITYLKSHNSNVD